MKSWIYAAIASVTGLALPVLAMATTTPESMNLRLIGHSSLNGAGKGGEGLALKDYGQRKVLFLAHESGPQCFNVVDVTNSAKPEVLKQVPVEAEFIRCNSLALSGNTLVVARQSEKIGLPHGGITAYDISDPSEPHLLSYLGSDGAILARHALPHLH